MALPAHPLSCRSRTRPQADLIIDLRTPFPVIDPEVADDVIRWIHSIGMALAGTTPIDPSEPGPVPAVAARLDRVVAHLQAAVADRDHRPGSGEEHLLLARAELREAQSDLSALWAQAVHSPRRTPCAAPLAHASNLAVQARAALEAGVI